MLMFSINIIVTLQVNCKINNYDIKHEIYV